jgi:hypothetical protein
MRPLHVCVTLASAGCLESVINMTCSILRIWVKPPQYRINPAERPAEASVTEDSTVFIYTLSSAQSCTLNAGQRVSCWAGYPACADARQTPVQAVWPLPVCMTLVAKLLRKASARWPFPLCGGRLLTIIHSLYSKRSANVKWSLFSPFVPTTIHYLET